MSLPTKVIVITGATSGIGLSLLERVLLETKLQFILRICILCRNMKKGEFVRSTLLLSHKSACIDLVNVDMADLKSVLNAAKTIKQKFNKIDFLYLNAGILPIKRLWIPALLSKDICHILKTGEHVMVNDNPVNDDGIPLVFLTNALGHFALFQELLPVLRSDESGPSSIIWTTSGAATKRSFDIEDFMCKHGPLPYGSSKYVINGLSIAINERYNQDGVYSSLAEPGLCVTGINNSFIPGWIWTIVQFVGMLLRVFMEHLTVTAYNGAEVLLWIFKQNPQTLNKNLQYESAVSISNRAFVKEALIPITSSEANQIYERMCEISQGFRDRMH